MATRYEDDVIAWANEQAALLRAGNFAALDLDHIAEEVEDVGKSEQRELESRMALLLAHLIKWAFQPERRGSSWETTIRNQRKAVATRLTKTPSLRSELSDSDWWDVAWGDAVYQAEKETGLKDLPAECPWQVDQIMDAGFLPD
jgi:Domain of unknown function DUF29